jgi:hypothetical protein
MNSSTQPIQRELRRVAIGLVAFTFVVASASVALLEGTVRRDVLASLAVVLGAMLIGFLPLRLLLRQGPDHIVSAWIASMILRMLACLVGLVLLLKKYELSPAICVAVVCGGYLVLLAAETFGLSRLIRRAFDRQLETKRN